jgi:hypothetical protein
MDGEVLLSVALISALKKNKKKGRNGLKIGI